MSKYDPVWLVRELRVCIAGLGIENKQFFSYHLYGNSVKRRLVVVSEVNSMSGA